MNEYRLKVEIAQLSLSDLGREDHAEAYTLSNLKFVHQALLPVKMP